MAGKTPKLTRVERLVLVAVRDGHVHPCPYGPGTWTLDVYVPYSGTKSVYWAVVDRLVGYGVMTVEPGSPPILHLTEDGIRIVEE